MVKICVYPSMLLKRRDTSVFKFVICCVLGDWESVEFVLGCDDVTNLPSADLNSHMEYFLHSFNRFDIDWTVGSWFKIYSSLYDFSGYYLYMEKDYIWALYLQSRHYTTIGHSIFWALLKCLILGLLFYKCIFFSL